jgi:hypothetical protein
LIWVKLHVWTLKGSASGFSTFTLITELQREIPIFLFRYIGHKDDAAITRQNKNTTITTDPVITEESIKVRSLALKRVEHGNSSTLRWHNK